MHACARMVCAVGQQGRAMWPPRAHECSFLDVALVVVRGACRACRQRVRLLEGSLEHPLFCAEVVAVASGARLWVVMRGGAWTVAIFRAM